MEEIERILPNVEKELPEEDLDEIVGLKAFVA